MYNKLKRNLVSVFLFMFLVCCAIATANGQDKKVRVLRLEVDGQTVDVRYTVTIVAGDGKSYKAKTEKGGFIVPSEVIAKNVDTFVGVIFKFKKYTLSFSAVHVSNFDVDWQVVGLNRKPEDETDAQMTYYIQFAGEPERLITVVVKKPNLAIRKIN
jgi:hypothetical protein